MRDIVLSDGKPLKLSPSQRSALKDYLSVAHHRALSNRYGVENIWRRCINGYQGQQPDDKRWTPFENAPVLEITLGASICDAIEANFEDLVFGVQPPVTTRAKHKQWDEAGDALQALIDWGTAPQGPWRFEEGIKEGAIDCIQLGTEVYYIPWVETSRKTDVWKTITFGPKIYAIDPNDFIVPENAINDIQNTPFCTWRMSYSKAGFRNAAQRNGWSMDDSQSADSTSMVRNSRFKAAGFMDGDGNADVAPIHIGRTFLYFDIDGDGIAEDLEIIWNMTSNGILKAQYNRYNCRPFVLKPYQQRAHLIYGQGVMEMALPYQQMDTEIHNNFVWNLMLSNTRMWAVPGTLMNEAASIYPGKVWQVDAGEKIEPVEMGSPNPQTLQTEAVVSGMASNRTGATSLNAPVKASSRTPATSMLTMQQAANRRFTHPFNNMRNGAGECVIQCVYRIQEQVRAGNSAVKKKLKDILGEDKAKTLIEYFKRSTGEILDGVDIQLKASSITVNKEADRQNWLSLATQLYPMYFQFIQQIGTLVAHPPFPGADIEAKKAMTVINHIMEKVLKTFDQVSDPSDFIIQLESIKPVMQQLGMEQIPGQMQGALTAFAGGPQDGGGGGGGLPQSGPQPGQNMATK